LEEERRGHQQGHGRRHREPGQTNEARPLRVGGTKKEAGPLGRRTDPGWIQEAGARGQDL